MNTSNSISATVMRRVRIIHAVRPLFSTTALASLLFLLAVWGIGREVWVSHVLSNLAEVSTAPDRVFAFLTSAFLNTRFVVQVLAILALGAGIALAREIGKTLLPRTHFA